MNRDLLAPFSFWGVSCVMLGFILELSSLTTFGMGVIVSILLCYALDKLLEVKKMPYKCVNVSEISSTYYLIEENKRNKLVLAKARAGKCKNENQTRCVAKNTRFTSEKI